MAVNTDKYQNQTTKGNSFGHVGNFSPIKLPLVQTLPNSSQSQGLYIAGLLVLVKHWWLVQKSKYGWATINETTMLLLSPRAAKWIQLNQ
jgi:hypothetical protein